MKLETSVASASHMMIWEGIELLPVIDDQNRLLGIISRQDVLKSLQTNQRQPHVGDTIDDIINNQIQKVNKHYTFDVSPQMTSYQGTLSYGVFTSVVTEAVSRSLRASKKVTRSRKYYDLLFKPAQIDSRLEIYPKILDLGRKFGKIDVEVYSERDIVGKALLIFQFIDR